MASMATMSREARGPGVEPDVVSWRSAYDSDDVSLTFCPAPLFSLTTS